MAEIEKFHLELTMAATITVYDLGGQATDWLKPAVSAGVTWKGMPTSQEVILGYQNLEQIGNATLEEVIANAKTRLDKELRR